MRMTLSRKILIGFIVCTLILVSVAIFSFRNSERFITTSRWVNHTYEVLREFDQVWAASLSVVSGSRGYIITGDEKFLVPYYDGIESVAEHLLRLKKVTEDNPVQQENLLVLERALDSSSSYRGRLIELARHNRKKAQQMVADGDGRLLQEHIKSIIRNCESIESRFLEERERASEDDSRRFNNIFALLLFLIAAVLILVYVIINANLKALKKAERESNDKNWLLSGNNLLNERTRGEQEVSDLAQAIIEMVCRYLDAQIGAVYLNENGYLKLSGAFAFDPGSGSQQIKIGEGLLGQAALEKKAILFRDVPPDYLKVNSAIGNTAPQSILVMPFLQDGRLKGVFEIGAGRELGELELSFMEMISENVAIVISAARSRQKLKELLEETQRQAEELETQQEELRMSNEELVEKTGQLERSETELKAQQEELQQANEELEEKANLLEAQKERLEDAKAEVEQKARELEITSKYKSEFLANMSHELRTPLNSILILSQLLSENKHHQLGEKEIGFARNIYNSGADLLNLINEILDLSKVESGTMELEISETRLEDIRRDILDMFDEMAKKKTIEFEIHVDQNLQQLKTDKQRLEQILRNLLSNAFKFTDNGGQVRLRIGNPLPGTIFKSKNLLNSSRILAFAVTDNGIGIPEEKLSIVFEAFQQADGTTKRKYGGTGLGLSISRELAGVLGGEIHVESEEGVGSTFTLYLPADFDPAHIGEQVRQIVVKEKTRETKSSVVKFTLSDEELEDDRYSIQGNDKCILIMEDDPVFARQLLSFVRERGYKAIVAMQGNTGLSYARHYKPDAIILDLHLPVINGTEVLKQIKNDPQLRHIPVQIISGYDKKKEGMELGAFDFVRKPISREDLKSAFTRIEEFVNRKLKRLLVIEDNEPQNAAIRELIGNGDVKCYSAYSGLEAYEMMMKDHYDCVIVDLGLPDMNGFELIEKIKSNEKLNRTPLVVYTGRDLSKEESNRLDKLANAVVLKTADSQERLLDETILFLHRVEAKLPKEKQKIIRKLHKTDEVLKNKSVLVVDDDIRNIYSLSNALEEEGVNCLIAENGRNALNMLKQHPSIDMILMDVMMPEMDGYEATREIRANSRYDKIPIIALTAKAMKGDREKCLDAGMSDYVSKPVNIEQLLSLMRVWLYK